MSNSLNWYGCHTKHVFMICAFRYCGHQDSGEEDCHCWNEALQKMKKRYIFHQNQSPRWLSRWCQTWVMHDPSNKKKDFQPNQRDLALLTKHGICFKVTMSHDPWPKQQEEGYHLDLGFVCSFLFLTPAFNEDSLIMKSNDNRDRDNILGSSMWTRQSTKDQHSTMQPQYHHQSYTK